MAWFSSTDQTNELYLHIDCYTLLFPAHELRGDDELVDPLNVVMGYVEEVILSRIEIGFWIYTDLMDIYSLLAWFIRS